MSKLEKLSTLIPLHLLEQGAQQQIYDALALDFLIKLAVMPDCHTGYTLPIGGVALLDSVISPEYVGYDIGCGMCYVVTDHIASKVFKNKKAKTHFLKMIHEVIPVGFDSRESALEYDEFKSASGDKNLNDKVASRLWIQLSTLGGGNHFIEIGENRKGNLTVTIHSGSRNIGHSIASHYMKLSKRADMDLPRGFLHLNGEAGQQYLQDMNFALQYALDNRKGMMKEVLNLLGYGTSATNMLMNERMVNENHNHAVIQDNLVLHRKGATPADKGQIGIIPGSMKTGVYVTEGLGNEEYLSSSSHGAGRKMSRKKAKKSIELSRVKEQMKGIVANINNAMKDEAPDAYKNIEDVISAQEGIVINTIDHAKPLIVAKG